MLPAVFVSAETGKFWYGTLKEEYWLEMVGKNIRSRARQVSRGDNTPGKIDSESDARMPFQYVCIHQLSGKVGELTEKRLTKRRIRRRNSLDCTVGQWNCSIEYRVFEYEDIYIHGYILWGETKRRRRRWRIRRVEIELSRCNIGASSKMFVLYVTCIDARAAYPLHLSLPLRGGRGRGTRLFTYYRGRRQTQFAWFPRFRASRRTVEKCEETFARYNLWWDGDKARK